MERLIKQDKHNRDRYIDIKVEDLKDGTTDIVKISGIVGSDKFSESRTNVKTGYEKARGKLKQLVPRYLRTRTQPAKRTIGA